MRDKTKKVWHPESSVASYDGCEEGGRGSTAPSKPGSAEVKRKRAIIPRRRVPTVDVRHVAKVAGLQCSSGEKMPRRGETYSTIEETGHTTLLDCPTEPARRLRNERVHCPNLCGWLEDESPEKYSFGKVVSMSMDRTSLQTPADHGSRLQSRAGSRYTASGKRRNHYEFKHFLDSAHEYIEHYRAFYCYTTLTVPPQVASTVVEDDTPQDPSNLFHLGVKSLYQGDPYLRELASRLGVRESIREQQLLQSPRPTPPSIVKKRKEREDLIICANGNKEEDISLKDETLNLTQNPSKVHASVSSHDTKPGSVELPKITQTTHTRHHNISNISITKYLQVTSHHQTDFTKQKDTTDAGPNSQHSLHSLPYSSVSDSSLSGEISEHLQNDASGSSMQEDLPHPMNMQVFLKDHLPSVDEVQKEKLLSSKAHALGLLSRDWAKTPHIRRMMGTRFAHEFTNAPYTYSTTPRGATKTSQECTGSNMKPNKSNTRRQTSREKTKTKGSSKIEQLRSIYEPAELSKRKKMGPRLSRLPSTKNHSRCVSRAFSRPATRFSHRDPMEDIKGIYSRPVTRFSRSQRPESRANKQVTITKEREQEIESLEEDSYWNELPVCIQTQLTTTIKQKRKIFPENTNAIPSFPTRQVHMHRTSRPPTRADSRLYSCGYESNLTTRLRKHSQSTLQQTAEHQVRKFMVG